MNRRRVWCLLTPVLLLSLCAAGFAGTAGSRVEGVTSWFSLEPVIHTGETSIDRMVINGPPEPPAGAYRPAVDLPETDGARALVTLSVPAYNWSFGSSATAAAMIAAYYDRTAYSNIYTGPTNSGVMPMDNSVWPAWIDTNGDVCYQCPLAASHNGLDGCSTNGHVDDYWSYYGQSGPDPYEGRWPEHPACDCTADFMKGNKWFSSQSYNVDGGTTFYCFTNGTRLTAALMETYGVDAYDGGYGLKLFYESRGYTVNTTFNQYIYGYNGNTDGFTWAEYMTEIDAGRPVLVHLNGSTVVGIGYDDTSGQLMYIHDTWDYNSHTMTWGGSYSGMDHYGVTIVRMALVTLVDLTSFGAKASADRVRLDWATASEMDNAGFNLWRCETKNGEFEQINKELIPAEGGVSWGATYDFTDTLVTPGRTYYYKLEDVNFAGDSTCHEPVSVRVMPLDFFQEQADKNGEGVGAPDGYGAAGRKGEQ